MFYKQFYTPVNLKSIVGHFLETQHIHLFVCTIFSAAFHIKFDSTFKLVQHCRLFHPKEHSHHSKSFRGTSWSSSLVRAIQLQTRYRPMSPAKVFSLSWISSFKNEITISSFRTLSGGREQLHSLSDAFWRGCSAMPGGVCCQNWALSIHCLLTERFPVCPS